MTTLTFADLVQFASENTFGALARPVRTTLTEGKTWEIPVHIDPGEGNTLDLAGVTISAAILEELDGATLATFTASDWEETGTGTNYFLLTIEDEDTAGLAGDGAEPIERPWFCTLTSGGDVVDVWGVQWSTVAINQGD